MTGTDRTGVQPGAEPPSEAQPLTYAGSGVDIAAGDRAVELMKASVARATRPEAVGGLGGFAGLFDASGLQGYRRPLLASATDGVGTKVAIAQELGIHDTIGQDLVAMVVDDLVVCGAEPLFMTDYICVGKVVPETVAAIVSGIAAGCALANTALVGGETAEHPGLVADGEYDVAGAATGVVEADALLGEQRVRPGDVLIAMPSSGLHANGFSLVRAILARTGWALDRPMPQSDRTLGEELLTPTRIYTRDCLDLLAAAGQRRTPGPVHAFSHITGGGLANNLARVIPAGLCATVDRSTWRVPAVFDLLGEAGGVPQTDRELTWNLGVGMIAVVAADWADEAVTRLTEGGVAAWVCGELQGELQSELHSEVQSEAHGEVHSEAHPGSRSSVHSEPPASPRAVLTGSYAT